VLWAKRRRYEWCRNVGQGRGPQSIIWHKLMSIVCLTSVVLRMTRHKRLTPRAQSSFWNRTIGKCEMIVSPRLSVDDKCTRFGTKCKETQLFECTHKGFALYKLCERTRKTRLTVPKLVPSMD
jgi:hypothetical protein